MAILVDLEIKNMKTITTIISIILISYALVLLIGTTDISDECSKHGIFYVTNCI